MTRKKPASSKTEPVRKRRKLHPAVLQNLAHQAIASETITDTATLQAIADMLTKLSPSSLHLVENIIRCVLDEQSAEKSDR